VSTNLQTPTQLPEDFDPFDWGDKPRASEQPKVEPGLPNSAGYEAFASDQGKPEYQFVKDAAQFQRSIKALQSLHPGFYGKAERWKPGGEGQFVKTDLYGFADIAGIRSADGRHVCAQVTSKQQVGAHIRKYLGDSKCDGNLVSYNLREFIKCGGIFVVLGYYKEPGKNAWQFTVTTVTTELLDNYIARKRG